MATAEKQPTPRRTPLPKNYKLPADFKSPWFMKMSKEMQRMFMRAHLVGETRAKNASKRDAETYAESPRAPAQPKLTTSKPAQKPNRKN